MFFLFNYKDEKSVSIRVGKFSGDVLVNELFSSMILGISDKFMNGFNF